MRAGMMRWGSVVVVAGSSFMVRAPRGERAPAEIDRTIANAPAPDAGAALADRVELVRGVPDRGA